MIYPILDQDCRALLSLVTFTTLCLLSCSLQVTWGEYKLIAMRRVACFQENGENLDSWIILDGEEWLSNERRELTAVDITLLGKWHRLENTADKTDERWKKANCSSSTSTSGVADGEWDGWVNRFGRPCGSAQSGVFATGPPLRNMWRCVTPRWRRRWANIENTLNLNSTDWKRATFWTKLCCALQIELDCVHIFNLTCLQLKRVICRRRWEAILHTSLAVGTHDCCALVAGDLSYFVPSSCSLHVKING